MGFVKLDQAKTDTMEFGGLKVDVVEAPRGEPAPPSVKGLVYNIKKVLVALSKGMRVTLGYLLRPSTVVTQQYPENREELKMFDRYRAQLVFKYNEKEEHNCTGCLICEMACPNASLILTTRKGVVTKKKEIDTFVWRWDICTFCNWCVAACPHDAIEWKKDFESAVYDRRLLIYNLNAYAGPPAKDLKKMEDPEDRARSMDTREIYSGTVPLAGVELPGIDRVGKEEED